MYSCLVNEDQISLLAIRLIYAIPVNVVESILCFIPASKVTKRYIGTGRLSNPEPIRRLMTLATFLDILKVVVQSWMQRTGSIIPK